VGTAWGGLGVEELRDAAAAVGLAAEPASSDSGADLVLINPAGGRILTQVKRVSLASGDSLRRQLIRRNARQESPLLVLVADRVTEQARELLRESGGSWLDLRGHLHLADASLFVDANIPPLNHASGQSTPLAGRVGQEVAAYLLLDPTRPASVREIARRINRSPSSVSQAITSMRDAALVDVHRRPTIPELFWELAARWQPISKDAQRHPAPTITGVTGSINDVLRFGLDNAETTTGWALGDTMAAAAYGAAVAVRSDHPPDFYVPDQATMRRALHLLGSAASHDARGATIRVAPIPLLCADRIELPDETWPLARPLFVALDLAQDPDRGRAVLDSWTPPEAAGQRVW
jgi:DNA-binding transcriptional ArsR family regulator